MLLVPNIVSKQFEEVYHGNQIYQHQNLTLCLIS